MISNESTLLHSQDAPIKTLDLTLAEADLKWDNTSTKARKCRTHIIVKFFPKAKIQQRRFRPFTLTKRITNTTYHIQDDIDPTITKMVRRNLLVENSFAKETLPPMIEEYVPMDRRHDNFSEKHMEQRIQKINNLEKFGTEDSLPFRIERLRTVPPAPPQKRIINTSINSGVNSPPILPPATPVNHNTSHHLQPYLMPSTSQVNFPSKTLTPIQQFIQKKP